MPELKYRVGIANEPQDSDLLYSDELEAINAAGAMCVDWKVPIAVWERMEIAYLLYLGQEFRSV